MKTLPCSAQMDLSIDITWTKDNIFHTEHYFADQFNSWRDIFPGSLFERLDGGMAKDSTIARVKPGELVPEYSSDKVLVLDRTRLDACFFQDFLHTGRFYPLGMISGLPGVFKGNINPFRLVDMDRDKVTIDLNHPMAKIPMTIMLSVIDRSTKPEERGGTCTDWMGLALDGPGMQHRYNRQWTNFFPRSFFDRADTGLDRIFYRTDRFVHHIDAQARQNLSDIYRTVVSPGDDVLDLMAGWESHIPDDRVPSSVHGLGLNRNELAKNPRLNRFTVQDLNTEGRLDFKDHAFDVVICSLSVEYLVDPVFVFKEVARVLKPGGRFVVSFSNRWFPEKAVRIWETLHDFERIGLVTGYFLESGRYESISTISKRGYPRPYADPYFPKFKLSDPVYAVMGNTMA